MSLVDYSQCKISYFNTIIAQYDEDPITSLRSGLGD